MHVNPDPALADELRLIERQKTVFYGKTDIDPSEIERLRRRKAELNSVDPQTVAGLLDEEVLRVESLPNAGTFHALFRVFTPEHGYFLKLSAEDLALDFHTEVWAMDTLRRLGLPFLDIPAYSSCIAQLPAPYLVTAEAPGQSLNQFECPDTQAMPEPLLFELGKILARVHLIEGTGAGPVCDTSARKPQGCHARWSDYIHLRLDDHLRECLQIRAITGMELSTIEGHFADADELLNSAPLRLLHGDPGHHNVFSDGQKITALIDWEDALSGDPIFDVAYWGTFVRDEMRPRFLDGYATVSPLPSDFERRYWLYYLRVAISKTVHRHRFGAQDRPGRPPASQRIQKALSNLAKL